MSRITDYEAEVLLGVLNDALEEAEFGEQFGTDARLFTDKADVLRSLVVKMKDLL